MIIADILKAKGNVVFTISQTCTIGDAIADLNAHNIGALVVVDASNKVTGILSERDIIRQMEGSAIETVLAQPISKCMTSRPFTCSPQDTLDDLMQTMTEKRVRHMPVIEDGQLVGLVSIGDAVKRKIEITEEEAAALRQYIAS